VAVNHGETSARKAAAEAVRGVSDSLERCTENWTSAMSAAESSSSGYGGGSLAKDQQYYG
jgi:hypothetical protein